MKEKAKEKIVIYKCPFYDECREGETYYADGKPYISIGGDQVCKGALFEDEQGDAVCCLSVPDQEAYKDAIKEVQRRYFRRPSVITRLKKWIRERR